MRHTNQPATVEKTAIHHVSCDVLQANARNARTHSPKQIALLMKSIDSFGFNVPILLNRDNIIIAGHGRVEAAKRLGYKSLPASYLDHLNEAEQRAYMITDNKLTELGGWDQEILAIELQYLTIHTDIDVSVTGFALPEIDLLIQKYTHPQSTEEPIPELRAITVTEPGDIWLLGDHRICCGDALSNASYDAVMQGDLAQLVFTDPPYNVPIMGHVSGLGSAKHPEFMMASGEMSCAEFTRFLRRSVEMMIAHTANGSIHYVCMDWRHTRELLDASTGLYAELKNLCVWNKDNGGMGSLYRSKYELVFVFKHGDAPHINNVELGKHGRYRTNVWDYAGQSSLHRNRDEELSMHPTVKPLAMVQDALLDCSRRGDIILDPFGGSGTTLIAAENTGRVARIIELAPRYVDVTIRRWQMLTGKKAMHAVTGETFDEIEAFAEALGVSDA
jgi:DNA modification methylase